MRAGEDGNSVTSTGSKSCELVGAFALDPDRADAALLRATEGQCTLRVSSATGGIGLFEIFDVGPGNMSRISVLLDR